MYNFALGAISAVDVVQTINWLFTTVLAAFVAFRIFYIIVGLFKVKRFPKTDKIHNYAIMISARNEEKVIGNLIDSIRKNNYPQDKITIFVVADNCDDNTANICREKGCIVYERFNKQEIGKGYALNFLVDHITKDYGIKSYDGYFVFDADNLLHPDFISRMNDVFATGATLVTAYRNIKNFDKNIISAGYGYHQYRNIRTLYIPRTVLNISNTITGTGFLMANIILKDGWKWKLITEDDELTADKIIEGHKVVYCNDAIHYDEQPETFRIMFRQRIRWAKGALLVFATRGKQLLKMFFSRKSKLYQTDVTPTQTTAQRRFSFYDMFFKVFPYALITFIWSILYDIALIVAVALSGMSVGECFAQIGIGMLSSLGTLYLSSFIQIIPVLICEWKKIKASAFKKIFYLFTFPLFDLFNLPIMTIALFSKVEWKTIPHTSAKKIEDIIDMPQKAEEKTEPAENEIIIEEPKAE